MLCLVLYDAPQCGLQKLCEGWEVTQGPLAGLDVAHSRITLSMSCMSKE